jgi:DNA integrity scanning protein DisA with diadenylate cyclase activity
VNVADDITLAEIGRRLDLLTAQVSQLVGRSEHEAHLLLRDQRINSLAEDITELKTRLTEAERQRGQVRLALFSSVGAPLITFIVLAVLVGKTLAG